tara:strand:+ start:312 stop:746 length:435 start_codon:yes stop_codon:yes gene_type:complete
MATTIMFNSSMKQKTTAPPKTQSENPLKQLEKVLDLYLGQKAPALPENIKEMIVSIAPWLILITVVFASPLILGALGLGAILAPLSFLGGVRQGVSFNIFLLLIAAGLVLEVMAIPGLFKKNCQIMEIDLLCRSHKRSPCSSSS